MSLVLENIDLIRELLRFVDTQKYTDLFAAGLSNLDDREPYIRILERLYVAHLASRHILLTGWEYEFVGNCMQRYLTGHLFTVKQKAVILSLCLRYIEGVSACKTRKPTPVASEEILRCIMLED